MGKYSYEGPSQAIYDEPLTKDMYCPHCPGPVGVNNFLQSACDLRKIDELEDCYPVCKGKEKRETAEKCHNAVTGSDYWKTKQAGVYKKVVKLVKAGFTHTQIRKELRMRNHDAVEAHVIIARECGDL